MLIIKKLVMYSFTAILLCTFPIVAHAATPAQRIGGSDRYQTSINTSYAGWASSKYAILATGTSYPDALSVATLAKKYNAPIILTKKDSVSDSIKNEFIRLNVSQVFIAGGTAVVSSAVEQQINSMGILTVRLAGVNRYVTSTKIAEQINNSDEVVITTGEDFADAMSISAIAANKGMPILLVSKNTIDASTKKYLASKNIKKTYVIGDSSIISDKVVNQLPNVERIIGNNKYERNVNIINKFANDIDFSRLYVANGEVFPDALSGSAIAAKTSSAILLTNTNPSSSTKNIISNNISKIKEVDVLGGSVAVSSSTLSRLGDIKELNYMSDILKPFYYDVYDAVLNSNMKMAGQQYNKGYMLTTYLHGKFSFNLGGKYKRISALIGLDDAAAGHDSTLNVFGDGEIIGTYTLKPGSLPQELDLNVTGISKLELQFKNIYGGDNADNVDIVNPILDFDGETLPSVANYTNTINYSNSKYMSDILKPFYYDVYDAVLNSNMTMAGQQYYKGYMLTTYLGGKFTFNLGDNYKRLSALIGLDDAAAGHDSTLNVLGDGKIIGAYTMKPGSLPQKLDLDVTGISKLELQFKNIYGGDNADNVDIVNPILQ